MSERAKFLVDLELDTLEEMTKILRQLDVEFDPVENMICLPQDGTREAIFTGQDMDEALEKANAYLQEEEDPQRFREKFWDLPPATRRDLMELLTLSADWEKRMILNEIDNRAWETFQEQHPEAVRRA